MEDYIIINLLFSILDLPVCLVCRSCCRPPIFLRAPCLCPSRWLGPCSPSKWSCELPQRSCRPQFDPISRRRHPRPFGHQIRCLRILWLKTEINLLYATICVSFYSSTLRVTESFLHDDCFKDMIEKNHDFNCFMRQVQLLKGHKK